MFYEAATGRGIIHEH